MEFHLPRLNKMIQLNSQYDFLLVFNSCICHNDSFFSSAWLCPQSSWNRNLSVVCRPSSVRPPVRPSSVRVAIISEPNARISFKFWLLLPLSHKLGCFFFAFLKKKFFYEYFSFSLTWDPMGAQISKRYSYYKSQPITLKLFSEFLPNDPHKTTFGILKIEILTIFLFR